MSYFLSIVLLFLLTSSSSHSLATGLEGDIDTPDMSTGPSDSSEAPPQGASGSAHGPTWDYSWGWGSGPGRGWGYGSGSGHSPTGFGRGSGYGFGSGTGSGSGYGYGSGSGGAHGGGYGSGFGSGGGGTGGSGPYGSHQPPEPRDRAHHG